MRGLVARDWSTTTNMCALVLAAAATLVACMDDSRPRTPSVAKTGRPVYRVAAAADRTVCDTAAMYPVPLRRPPNERCRRLIRATPRPVGPPVAAVEETRELVIRLSPEPRSILIARSTADSMRVAAARFTKAAMRQYLVMVRADTAWVLVPTPGQKVGHDRVRVERRKGRWVGVRLDRYLIH